MSGKITDNLGRSSGLIKAASGGAAGNLAVTLMDMGPSSGETYTAQSNANYIVAYVGGGGGGAGRTPGNSGGAGGFGVYATPISQPYSKDYAIGAAGTGFAAQGVAGNAGGATTFGDPATVTANGGAGGPTGTVGSAPGSNLDITQKGASNSGSSFGKSARALVGTAFYHSGPGHNRTANATCYLGQGGIVSNIANDQGASGGQGFLLIYENIGT